MGDCGHFTRQGVRCRHAEVFFGKCVNHLWSKQNKGSNSRRKKRREQRMRLSCDEM